MNVLECEWIVPRSVELKTGFGSVNKRFLDLSPIMVEVVFFTILQTNRLLVSEE